MARTGCGIATRRVEIAGQGTVRAGWRGRAPIPASLAGMRNNGLQLVTDLRAHGGIGAQIAGARLEGEMAAWWGVADAMSNA